MIMILQILQINNTILAKIILMLIHYLIKFTGFFRKFFLSQIFSMTQFLI